MQSAPETGIVERLQARRVVAPIHAGYRLSMRVQVVHRCFDQPLICAGVGCLRESPPLVDASPREVFNGFQSAKLETTKPSQNRRKQAMNSEIKAIDIADLDNLKAHLVMREQEKRAREEEAEKIRSTVAAVITFLVVAALILVIVATL